MPAYMLTSTTVIGAQTMHILDMSITCFAHRLAVEKLNFTCLQKYKELSTPPNFSAEFSMHGHSTNESVRERLKSS